VVSDGEFIAQGKRIRVLSVQGNRIVVREIGTNDKEQGEE
jgi:membrane-bound ClpP family serine protease